MFSMTQGTTIGSVSRPNPSNLPQGGQPGHSFESGELTASYTPEDTDGSADATSKKRRRIDGTKHDAAVEKDDLSLNLHGPPGRSDRHQERLISYERALHQATYAATPERSRNYQSPYSAGCSSISKVDSGRASPSLPGLAPPHRTLRRQQYNHYNPILPAPTSSTVGTLPLQATLKQHLVLSQTQPFFQGQGLGVLSPPDVKSRALAEPSYQSQEGNYSVQVLPSWIPVSGPSRERSDDCPPAGQAYLQHTLRLTSPQAPEHGFYYYKLSGTTPSASVPSKHSIAFRNHSWDGRAPGLDTPSFPVERTSGFEQTTQLAPLLPRSHTAGDGTNGPGLHISHGSNRGPSAHLQRRMSQHQQRAEPLGPLNKHRPDRLPGIPILPGPTHCRRWKASNPPVPWPEQVGPSESTARTSRL